MKHSARPWLEIRAMNVFHACAERAVRRMSAASLGRTKYDVVTCSCGVAVLPATRRCFSGFDAMVLPFEPASQ